MSRSKVSRSTITAAMAVLALSVGSPPANAAPPDAAQMTPALYRVETDAALPMPRVQQAKDAAPEPVSPAREDTSAPSQQTQQPAYNILKEAGKSIFSTLLMIIVGAIVCVTTSICIVTM